MLTPAEHALLGERLLDVRHGLRAPTPQGMLEACAETPCPAGSSRPLERKIPVGTTFVSLHVMVPKEGSWPILYTRTCSPGGDMALPVWAAPVERRMELRGDVGGAASVNLVDRFDVPAGARMLSCTLKVIDPSSDGLLFVREVLVPG